MDKIFVNHYLREIEIGAFQSERGCTQRVEFNVWLEIGPLADTLDDNVDKVMSYEIITDAINVELESRRFNLLETLAENIATRCLQEPRVTLVEIKIEKLDRIPGTLGICISRFRDSQVSYPEVSALAEKTAQCSLIKFSSLIVEADAMKPWVSALNASNKNIIILIEPDSTLINNNLDEYARNQVALLSMEQNAWRVSCLDKHLVVASTKEELYWALKSEKITLFCPSHFVRQSVSNAPNFEGESNEFYIWFAHQFGIKEICSVGLETKQLRIEQEGCNIRYFNADDWNLFK